MIRKLYKKTAFIAIPPWVVALTFLFIAKIKFPVQPPSSISYKAVVAADWYGRLENFEKIDFKNKKAISGR